jgi:hypothetical protein
MIGVLPPAVRDGRFAPAAFLRLSTYAPLSRSPNRRPKQNQGKPLAFLRNHFVDFSFINLKRQKSPFFTLSSKPPDG